MTPMWPASATESGTGAIRPRWRPWPAYKSDEPRGGRHPPLNPEQALSAPGGGHGRLI